MSATSEKFQADPSRTASLEESPDADQSVGPSLTANAKPSEKTISCVSCRKRKLKCDRVKPKCGTCTKLRHECEFPERRRNVGSKRRNIKELEARLAQVETQLISESKQNVTAQKNSTPGGETDWDGLGMDMNLDLALENNGLLEHSFDISQHGLGFSAPAPNMHNDYFGSYELIALGLQEPLPAKEMMDELHHIYFSKHHQTMPMIHKLRYYASLDRAPHMRPPVSLRYAIWTTAASLSEKYSSFEPIFYERARRYLQDAEMKGHGETFVSLYYVQAWSLIAHYEASKTLFTRAWMSVGRTCRLAQMLGLYRLDDENPHEQKNLLPPSQDWIELEERRRTFWAAFYHDRWASSGTGWPMIIDDDDISTNLPASEKSFENGVREETLSLQKALTPEGASKLSSFGGVVVSATLFGNNNQHLRQKGPNERPEDLDQGEFWKRHRKMDNALSNTFMFLPDHLRLPQNIRDINVVFLHMNVHAASICLHQAAILTAKKYKIDPNFIELSRNRNLMSAEEITSITRLISHMDVLVICPWLGYCLYVAGGVLIQDVKSDRPRPQTLSNLEFLFLAMRAIGSRHSITNHFTAQLELDLNAAGINDSIAGCPITFNSYASHAPDARRFGELSAYSAGPMPSMTGVVEDIKGSNIAAGLHKKGFVNEETPGKPHMLPYFILELNRREQELATELSARIGPKSGKSESAAARTSQDVSVTTDAFYPFDQDSLAPTGDTPSSDSSSSNKMQGNSNATPPEPTSKSYPYRDIDPSNHGGKPYGIFQADLRSFGDFPARWDVQPEISGFGDDRQEVNRVRAYFSGFDSENQPSNELHDFIGSGPWSTGPVPE